MCFFMFAISKEEIDISVLERIQAQRLFVRDNSSLNRDFRKGLYYYDINNGHCACEIVVSSFSRINEVKDVLRHLGEKGAFRFVILDREEESIEDFMNNEKYFEEMIGNLESRNISLDELLMRYPDSIEFDKLYKVQ